MRRFVQDLLGRDRVLRRGGAVVSNLLNSLALSANSISEGAAAGTVVGTILNTTPGSALSLSVDAGGRFAISAGKIVAGATATDYETATSHSITVVETLAGKTNSPNSTVLTVNVANVFEAASLNALTGSLSIAENSANGSAVGTPTGYTAGSTKSLSDNAGGRFAINSSTGQITVANGSLLDYETATSHNVTIVETLADSPNSPRSTSLTIAVTDVFEGAALAAPVLSNLSTGWTAGQNPPDWDTQLFDAVAYDSGTGAGSSVRAQWRLGGAGAWTVEAWQGLDDELTSGVFSWPLLAAADLGAGGLFEVQVQHGIDVGLGTEHLSAWSNTWSDTLTATAVKYRYYRINITASNSGSAITTLSEIEIASTVGGADTTAGQIYTDSDNDGASNTGAKAFDDSTSTFYSSDTSPLAPFPHIITVDYGATSANWVSAKQLKMRARSDNGGQMAENFTLDGSNDGASWTTIITVTNATGWANGETRTYVAP